LTLVQSSFACINGLTIESRTGQKRTATRWKDLPRRTGFDWFRPGRWVEVGTPWTGAWGFEHIPPDEERRRIGVMENATKVMFPPAKIQLRFSPRATEEREEEQRRIISLRDMVM